MELVGVSDRGADLADGIAGHFQQGTGFGHAVADQEFLGRFPDGIPKDLAEVTAVEPGTLRDVFYGDILHIVGLNERKSFFNIKILHVIRGSGFCKNGAHHCVNEDIEMSDQMIGGLFFMIYDIEHFIPHQNFLVFVHRIVDRMVDG